MVHLALCASEAGTTTSSRTTRSISVSSNINLLHLTPSSLKLRLLFRCVAGGPLTNFSHFSFLIAAVEFPLPLFSSSVSPRNHMLVVQERSIWCQYHYDRSTPVFCRIHCIHCTRRLEFSSYIWKRTRSAIAFETNKHICLFYCTELFVSRSPS